MANKYQSNIRTYSARNLLWNHKATQGAIPNGLFTVSPPTSVSIDNSSPSTNPDFVTQFYDTALGAEGWNPSSNLIIRRCGIFSNLADGLVFENIEGRIGLNVKASVYSIAAAAGCTISYVNGSNLVTGTNLLTAFPLGYGFIGVYPLIISPFYTKYLYAIYVIDNTHARLSNYHTGINTTGSGVHVLRPLHNYTFRIPAIPVFNMMYETEVFFPVNNHITGNNAFISSEITLDTIDSKYNFYTKSMDTSFIGSPLTMDAVIEAEITPV